MSETQFSYRVAWTPPAGSPLASFGAHWFGWCAERAELRGGRAGTSGRPFGAMADAAGAGCLHAPLIAEADSPLENGASFVLDARLARLAAETAPVEIGELEVVSRPSGLALAPTLPSVALARVMRETAAALGSVAPADFCLPLTGPLYEADAEIVSAGLTCTLDPAMRRGHVLGELTLIGYAGAGRRPVLLNRFELGGVPAARREPPGALACSGPDVLVAEPIPFPGPRRAAAG